MQLLLLGSALGWLLARLVGRRDWPLARFVVDDLSMAPTLLPGDRLLVWCWLPRRRPRPGDVVVLRDPEVEGRFLVKRVHSPDPAGPAEPVSGVVPAGPLAVRYTVRGDNSAQSRDSRQFGPIARERLVGRAVWRYLPGTRRGRIASALPQSLASADSAI